MRGSIELQVQEQPAEVRSAVYSHLEAFVPCNKEALLKRLKKLSLNIQVCGSDGILRLKDNKNVAASSLKAESSFLQSARQISLLEGFSMCFKNSPLQNSIHCVTQEIPCCHSNYLTKKKDFSLLVCSIKLIH